MWKSLTKLLAPVLFFLENEKKMNGFHQSAVSKTIVNERLKDLQKLTKRIIWNAQGKNTFFKFIFVKKFFFDFWFEHNKIIIYYDPNELG